MSDFKDNLGEAFSSIDLVGQCLIDEVRTLAFKEAINSKIKLGQTSLDLGTGSAIMALFSANAGAKEVYGLEFDPFVASIAKENVKNNNLEKTISILEGDARDYIYPPETYFDVITAEMLTTGMIDEYQIQAINNLFKQGVVDEKTVFIPNKQTTEVSLINSDFSIYGFELKMVKHLWNNLSENQRFENLSTTEILNKVVFSKINNENFEKIVEFKVEKDGVVNGLIITSTVHLTETLKIGDTETLNAPVVWPLEDVKVQKGDILKYIISYKFGGGYNSFKVNRVI